MRCIHAAQVTAPKQLPHNIRPQNHPNSRHMCSRLWSFIRFHRMSMVQLAKAQMQYAAIW
jgi:hypothetical protein